MGKLLDGHVATFLIVALVAIVAVVGGAVVIWGDPGVLSFNEYLDYLKNFAYAVAGIGGARAVLAAGKAIGSK